VRFIPDEKSGDAAAIRANLRLLLTAYFVNEKLRIPNNCSKNKHFQFKVVKLASLTKN